MAPVSLLPVEIHMFVTSSLWIIYSFTMVSWRIMILLNYFSVHSVISKDCIKDKWNLMQSNLLHTTK